MKIYRAIRSRAKTSAKTDIKHTLTQTRLRIDVSITPQSLLLLRDSAVCKQLSYVLEVHEPVCGHQFSFHGRMSRSFAAEMWSLLGTP